MDKQFMEIFGAFSDMNRADRELMLESLESLHKMKKHKENMSAFDGGKSISEIFRIPKRDDETEELIREEMEWEARMEAKFYNEQN